MLLFIGASLRMGTRPCSVLPGHQIEPLTPTERATFNELLDYKLYLHLKSDVIITTDRLQSMKVSLQYRRRRRIGPTYTSFSTTL